MIALLLNPIARYVALGLAASILAGGLYYKVHHNGYLEAVEDVKHKNEQAIEAAEARGVTVDACYALGSPWVWSVSKARCIKSER